MPAELQPLSIEERKRTLRRRMRAMRLVAEQKEGPDAALAVARLALARLADLGLVPGTVVAGYWPISTEVDVRPLLARLERAGMACALPAIEEGRNVLVFRRWHLGEPLVSGIFETLQPPATAPEVVPSALLVPLLAVDRSGARLGHGRGWYDRTLATLRESARASAPLLAIGVCFASQVLESVPCDGHDQPVDRILTGSDLVRCQSRP